MNEKVRDLQHFAELYESGREFCYKNVGKADVANWPIEQILEHINEARLYVESNTVMIEIPKPMSDHPAFGQEYFYLAPSTMALGWQWSKWRGDAKQEKMRFKNGIWRTQEEIEQVVAAMRGAK